MTNWKKNRIYTLLKDCLSKDGEIYELIIPSDNYVRMPYIPMLTVDPIVDENFKSSRYSVSIISSRFYGKL